MNSMQATIERHEDSEETYTVCYSCKVEKLVSEALVKDSLSKYLQDIFPGYYTGLQCQLRWEGTKYRLHIKVTLLEFARKEAFVDQIRNSFSRTLTTLA